MFTSSAPLVLVIISLPLLANTQTQQPDGLIVPFTSVLPACASLCGKLFDVQGACVPPAVATVSTSCFCGDPRLQSISKGTADVEEVCGAASCQDAADLQKIQNWYDSFCNIAQPSPTTAAGSTSTGTGMSTSTDLSVAKPASPQYTNNGWFATHWRWVVMIIVLAVGLSSIWLGAILIRRRYIRKREKEIEMRPPVAWGPHQMQGATGGYSDGVIDAAGAKEARSQTQAFATPADASKRGSKGWLKKTRLPKE